MLSSGDSVGVPSIQLGRDTCDNANNDSNHTSISNCCDDTTLTTTTAIKRLQLVLSDGTYLPRKCPCSLRRRRWAKGVPADGQQQNNSRKQ